VFLNAGGATWNQFGPIAITTAGSPGYGMSIWLGQCIVPMWGDCKSHMVACNSHHRVGPLPPRREFRWWQRNMESIWHRRHYHQRITRFRYMRREGANARVQARGGWGSTVAACYSQLDPHKAFFLVPAERGTNTAP
jgi:hypothetical protein